MYSPQLLLPLAKAKDQADSSQELAKIFVANRVQSANRVQGCCSHRERSKRCKSMFAVCCHRKETSIEVHQERRQFKVDARFTWWVMAGVQHKRRLVATTSLREGSSLRLTSLESAMDIRSKAQLAHVHEVTKFGSES